MQNHPFLPLNILYCFRGFAQKVYYTTEYAKQTQQLTESPF